MQPRLAWTTLAVSLCIALPQPAWTQAAAGEPIRIASGVEQKTLRFARFRSTLRDGDRIGEIRTGSCTSPMLLTMNARTEQAVMGPVPRVVREEFLRAGYQDPIRAQQKLFDDDSGPAPDLLLGGMLEEFHTRYCSAEGGSRTDGSVRLKVRWELYDTSSREVVHSTTIESVYETRGAEAMREGEFFSMAYRDAVRQLLADRQFHDRVVVASAAASAARSEPAAPAPAKLVLKPAAPISDALKANMTLTRAAVVTVSHAAGSGSGFFISEDGYVVTNSHVVGSHRFVRVILATGRELVGEVMQRDAARDVALIKTEGSNFMALAVGSDDVNVGEEVTAIGSPLGEALSGTVTRGIVSAYRTIKGQRFIQSDVPILPGSSGGPLLDRSGRVVGIAVAGLSSTRINFFVPIQEALGSLGVTLASQ